MFSPHISVYLSSSPFISLSLKINKNTFLKSVAGAFAQGCQSGITATSVSHRCPMSEI